MIIGRSDDENTTNETPKTPSRRYPQRRRTSTYTPLITSTDDEGDIFRESATSRKEEADSNYCPNSPRTPKTSMTSKSSVRRSSRLKKDQDDPEFCPDTPRTPKASRLSMIRRTPQTPKSPRIVSVSI